MKASLERYLIVYLIVIIITYMITLFIYIYYVDQPVAQTTKTATTVAADVDLVIKAGCAILIANSEAPPDPRVSSGTTIIKNLYPPDSAGVAKCRALLAS